MRIVVLGTTDNEYIFARAPSRLDRRAHSRCYAEGVALVQLGGKQATLDLHDISEGGIGLGAPYAVEVGENIKLLLRLEGKSSLPLECEGVVRSCRRIQPRPDGACHLGIKFTRLPAPLREAIQRLVRNSED